MKLKLEGATVRKECINLAITLIAAILSAFALHVFIYPANFAPAGIDGVATMLQAVTGVNAGYYTLALNLPLLAIAYFVLKKRYVIYTVIFTVLASVMLVILEDVGFYTYVSETDRLIPAIFAGAIHGVRTGLMLRIGASAGGVDIVGCMIQKKKPHLNVERIITVICYVIVLASYFVYKDVSSILLAIVQMFIFDKFCGSLLRDHRNAIEFKIITKSPELVRDDIIYNLKHGATLIDSKGMFTDDKSSIIICVINVRQIPELLEIIKKHPETFAYYGELLGVRGNFRWHKDDIAK